MHVDHTGIATDDAKALAELYLDLFDCELAHQEQFDGMKMIFLDFGNSYFELLEPIEGDGAIASYLDRKGPGIHHLAIATDDINQALERALKLDIELLDETPRAGAWGHDVAFLHPSSTGGVLVEFVQH